MTKTGHPKHCACAFIAVVVAVVVNVVVVVIVVVVVVVCWVFFCLFVFFSITKICLHAKPPRLR